MRGVLRIDDEDHPGVWLQVGSEWSLVDEQPARPWRWFADRDLEIVGERNSIDARFVIESLRIANPVRGIGPYFSIGPAHELVGELVVEDPPGKASKRALFRGDDGGQFEVLGDDLPIGPVKVRARVLEPDLSYVARGNGPDLWIEHHESLQR